MKIIKRILIILLVVLVGIQFIQPEKNISDVPSPNDIRVHYAVPSNVLSVLKRACYDCHSNNTNYPWYSYIQPIGFWLNDHIKHGKGELNFSEFASYSAKKAAHKLEEIVEMVEDEEMPLESYVNMHSEAKLTDLEKELLIKWVNDLRETIENKQ